MKTFKQITLPRILSVISILFLASCAATPDIHLKIPGTDMELTRKAQLAMRLAVSPKNNLVLVGSDYHSFNLWNISTGQKLKSFKMSSSFIGSAFWTEVYFFPNDSTKALSSRTSIKIWDIETGQELRRLIGHEGTFREGMVNYVKFSPDGQYALSGGSDKTLRLWDVETGKLIRTFRGHTDVIYSVAFSSDSKLALSGSWDSTVRLWDVATGETIRVFKGHSQGYKSAFDPGVYRVSFTNDNRYALSVGDASLRVWDITSGQEIAMMVSFEDGEWLTITPEGYYNSSENGAQYLSVIFGDNKYGVDKFYDVFYRPDIVAAKLRGKDIKDLITITMKDAIKSPPPSVEFTTIPSDADKSRVKVCYRAKSAGGGIGEVRLFHNGKLIESDGYYKEVAKTSEKMQLASLTSNKIYEDMRSVKIKGVGEISPIKSKAKGEQFEACKEVDAIAGENEISITAFNKDNTVQGYMQTAKFNSTIKQEEPHLYILSIGIDQYQDKSVNLKYAVKDAKDIEEKLRQQSASLYDLRSIHYTLLANDQATKSAILGKINELEKTVKPTDSFILFVAGHGILLQNQYYMLTSDYDGKVNEDTMISSNEIVEMSKKIKSLSQLFIFDTCHAGGVDYIVSGLYDARMSVLAKKMGLHIYASANSKEAAMDGYQGNGLFTYTLLDGLNNNRNADKNKDNKVSLTELGEYSKQTTTEISKKIGHQQTPLIINFGKDNPIYNLK